MKFFLNIISASNLNHISYHVFLCVKYYVSELAKIFTDNFCVIVLVEEDLLGRAHEHF